VLFLYTMITFRSDIFRSLWNSFIWHLFINYPPNKRAEVGLSNQTYPCIGCNPTLKWVWLFLFPYLEQSWCQEHGNNNNNSYVTPHCNRNMARMLCYHAIIFLETFYWISFSVPTKSVLCISSMIWLDRMNYNNRQSTQSGGLPVLKQCQVLCSLVLMQNRTTRTHW
jgi:hypothetical protein